MPLAKIVSKVAKKAAAKKAASANARGLKAAKGPSKAPKGYIPDTVGRAAVAKKRSGQAVYTAREAAEAVSRMRSSRTTPNFEGAIKLTQNVVSKSGRKANTPKLMKKAAKKAK